MAVIYKIFKYNITMYTFKLPTQKHFNFCPVRNYGFLGMTKTYPNALGVPLQHHGLHGNANPIKNFNNRPKLILDNNKSQHFNRSHIMIPKISTLGNYSSRRFCTGKENSSATNKQNNFIFPIDGPNASIILGGTGFIGGFLYGASICLPDAVRMLKYNHTIMDYLYCATGVSVFSCSVALLTTLFGLYISLVFYPGLRKIVLIPAGVIAAVTAVLMLELSPAITAVLMLG